MGIVPVARGAPTRTIGFAKGSPPCRFRRDDPSAAARAVRPDDRFGSGPPQAVILGERRSSGEGATTLRERAAAARRIVAETPTRPLRL